MDPLQSPRKFTFIVDAINYAICEQTNAFSIVVCDYNKDGCVDPVDKSAFLSKYNTTVNEDDFEENCVYDFNRDGYINALDWSVFYNFYLKNMKSIYDET